jgi:predicted ATPase/DNA-binding XRE family transcriptional regulator
MLRSTSLGFWIKCQRLALHLTQEELGRLVGCAAITIRKIEADERRPSLQLAEQLARHFDLPVEERAAFLKVACAELSPDHLTGLPAAGQMHGKTAGRAADLLGQRSPLVGRAREMRALKALLRRADVALLTLVGPPGVGKTRLALQLAAGFTGVYEEGVRIVELAPLRDPGLVLLAIAQALGVQAVGNQPLIERLASHLCDKHLLLLLDNFEHVIASAPVVAKLLARAPRLKVLVTSRRPLHLSEEQQFPVPPLPLPPLDDREKGAGAWWKELLRYGAVALFIQHAQAVEPAFHLTAANAAAVAAICGHLDGLPLAIELAAARIKLLPPQTLLEQLDRRLALLTGGAQDRPSWHQSLRGALAWSYELLGNSEQALFARLGVCAGGCTLEAVTAICGDQGAGIAKQGVEGAAHAIESDRLIPTLRPAPSILDGLTKLLDQSLLWQQADVDGEPRFGMLETIREYALEQLEARGEVAAVQRRQLQWCLSLAERAEWELWGAQRTRWIERLEGEQANCRAALAWSMTDATSAAIGLRLASALHLFWSIRGNFDEGRMWLTRLLGCVEPSAVPLVRAKALNLAGRLALRAGDPATARTQVEAALAIYQQMANQGGSAWSLCGLGSVMRSEGDHVAARGYFETALAIYREIGHRGHIASTLIELGIVLSMLGQYGQAAATLDEGLALACEIGLRPGIAWAQLHKGATAQAQGDTTRAAQLFGASLALFRELGDQFGILWALIQCGTVARYQQDSARAAALLEEGLALARELHDLPGIACALLRLGLVARDRGDILGAASFYRKSLTMFWRAGMKYDCAVCLEGVASGAEAQGQVEQAVRLYGAAAALREALGTPIPPVERANHERNLVIAHAQLGGTALRRAWAEGVVMTLDQAAGYALEWTSS